MIARFRGCRSAWLLSGCLALAGTAQAQPVPTGPAPTVPILPTPAAGESETSPTCLATPPQETPSEDAYQVVPGSAPVARRRFTDLRVPAIVPAPIGTYTRNAFQEETDLAKAERMVIYQEEWVRGAPKVKDCAMSHLDKVADWLATARKPYVSFPVRVEPTGDPNLDRTRRLTVVNYLVERGVGDAEQRVVLASPYAEGLQGDIIERIYHSGARLGTGAPSLFGTTGGATNVGPGGFFGGGFGGSGGFGGGFRGF